MKNLLLIARSAGKLFGIGMYKHVSAQIPFLHETFTAQIAYIISHTSMNFFMRHQIRFC